MGTGIGDLFQTVCVMAIMHYGLSIMNNFLIMSLTLMPYFLFFTYFESARLSHKQHWNVYRTELVALDDPRND